MKKTIKVAALKQPGNHWISRRVYEDEAGVYYVKINDCWVAIDWCVLHDWAIDICW